MITGDVQASTLAPNTPSARDDIKLRLLAFVLIAILGSVGVYLWVLGNALPASF
jgi:hypothetical protein